MRKHYILAAVAALASFTACINDDEKEMNQNVPVHFNITSESITTRATTTASGDNYSTTFENNDEIGIYTSGLVDDKGVQSTTTDMSNAKYTYKGSTLTAADNSKQYYYPKTGEAKFYAYYPYSETAASNGVVSFGVQTDQSVEANFKKSDFMTCVKTQASTSQAITLSMSHRLALVEVVLTNMDGASVEINDVKTTATWTYATDAISTTESSTANVKMLQQNNSTTHWALVPAQAIAKGSKLFTITLSGNTYYYTITTDAGLTLASNKVNRFSLTRTVRGNVVETPNVTGDDWSGVENGGNGEVEDKNYITLPSTGNLTGINGITGVNASVPWGYLIKDQNGKKPTENGYTGTPVSFDGNTNTFSIKTEYSQSAHWINQSIAYFNNENLEKAQYKLSFNAKGQNSSSAVVIAVLGRNNISTSVNGSPKYFSYFMKIINGSNAYSNCLITVGTDKNVEVIIDTNNFVFDAGGATSPVSSWTSSTESDEHSNYLSEGFKVCIGFSANDEFSIKDLKLTKVETASN